MQVPVERSFRDLSQAETDLANSIIDQRVARIERLAPEVISCRVAVSRPQEHQRSGSPFRARVRVSLPPHKELVAAKDPSDSDASGVEQILRETFDAVERQVVSVTAQRDQHKPQTREETGFVVRLFAESGYGFIRTNSAEEVFFHRNSVFHGDFDRIEIGTQVRFAAEQGENGVQATTVHILDKPGARRERGGTVDEEYVPESWKP